MFRREAGPGVIHEIGFRCQKKSWGAAVVYAEAGVLIPELQEIAAELLIDSSRPAPDSFVGHLMEFTRGDRINTMWEFHDLDGCREQLRRIWSELREHVLASLGQFEKVQDAVKVHDIGDFGFLAFDIKQVMVAIELARQERVEEGRDLIAHVFSDRRDRKDGAIILEAYDEMFGG